MKAWPTRERILELLNVDVETGIVTWRRSAGRARAGDVAGRIHAHGYRIVQLDKIECRVHSIVWFIATGDWPELIDHLNGERADNRFANLREADAATNARNRTNWAQRKLLGAHLMPDGKFRASITSDECSFHLGVFSTGEEAHARYREARDRCAEAERLARFAVLEAMRTERSNA